METNYFEYSEFSNVKKVDEGAFGIRNGADWSSGGIKLTLKIFANNLSINEDNMKIFLNEVILNISLNYEIKTIDVLIVFSLLFLVKYFNFHPNINRFFG